MRAIVTKNLSKTRQSPSAISASRPNMDTQKHDRQRLTEEFYRYVAAYGSGSMRLSEAKSLETLMQTLIPMVEGTPFGKELRKSLDALQVELAKLSN